MSRVCCFIPKIPFFVDAAAKIESYFQRVISLLNASKREGDIAWIAACKLLQFGEPQGFALGYGVHKPNGRGVGPTLAAGLASRAQQILKLGVDDPLIFEVIELFTDGIGPDLISDTQASILEENFLAYSQDIANKLKITNRVTRIIQDRSYSIPAGPNGRGIILLPAEFLTPLPIEMPWESIEYATALDDSVRKQLSELFALAAKRPKKSEVANIIFPHRDVLERLLKSFRESVGAKYDFENDPMGVLRWFEVALNAVQANPEKIGLERRDAAGLVDVVNKITLKFKQNVEQNGLWKEFYREDLRPKHERFGHLVFYAIADAYCDANNLDISRESNGGNGPVDFKLSQGADFKYLVEMKLSTNPKLLDGYTVQLDAYAASEKAEKKSLVVIKLNGKGRN
ncbi:hypothetical protein EDE15_3570 [Edaphobacter aggregans]|uniref:PD-(D/E)XK nuclease superfamily protein n=1 Tax=Edaphobacter aggregans TaxID=570835 RepID=A0A3R9NYX9_9BACT|nr:hypothetical protein [Edaphobacter aggregans]RSL18014.1 hypothetical protein EDE15_3570 [Edaphobacter aggregans]